MEVGHAEATRTDDGDGRQPPGLWSPAPPPERIDERPAAERLALLRAPPHFDYSTAAAIRRHVLRVLEAVASRRGHPPRLLLAGPSDNGRTTLARTLAATVEAEGVGSAWIMTMSGRASHEVLGLSIGFSRPSYASFLDGLRHALYPKDLSGYPGIHHPWLGFGRFRKLYVDNETAFIGHDIRNAAAELVFEIAEFRPGSLWLKGAEEKLQGDLNRAVSHKLPGSTFSTPPSANSTRGGRNGRR